MPKLHSVPDDVPDVLRAPEFETVAIAVDASVPFVTFADAIVRAGLAIRGDGSGGILIVKQADGDR